MPNSCKCILDKMVFKGAMTEKERDKILRNIKTDWIPVTERLPENEGEYLVSLVNETYMVSYFDGNRFWCLCEIDAWMPFPKRYKEGAEECGN